MRSITGSTFASQPNWAIVTANGPSMTHMRGASIDNTLFPETVLSFDVPMNRNSVSAAIRIVPDVTLDLSWNGSRLTIKPAQALQPGARYHLTLLAGQTGARSTEGLPMVNPYQWDWTMPELLVQTQHIKENSVSIVSSYVLDSQKTGFPYQIVPEVSGKWKWVSKTSLRFEADTNFLPNQQYQLQLVSPLYTETGEDLGLANELSFLAPLPFGDIFPKKEKHSYDYHQLNIVFTRPMDKLSIENAFSISPPVHGSFRWIGNKLTFHFTNQLQIGDPLEYEITLDTTAKDEDGNQILAKPYMWTYTIPSRVVDRYYEETLFGYGAMDQVIDVNGRRAVHINAHSDWITFKLFRLNLSQYSTMHAAFNGNESRSDHDWQNICKTSSYPTAGPTVIKKMGLMK
jgi:hypothetical protein